MSTSSSRGPLPVPPSPSLRRSSPRFCRLPMRKFRRRRRSIFPAERGRRCFPVGAGGRRTGDEVCANWAGRKAKAKRERILKTQLAREREAVAAAVGQFTRERSAYYQKLEGEVVQTGVGDSASDPAPGSAGRSPAAHGHRAGCTGENRRRNRRRCSDFIPQNSSDWRRYLGSHIEPGDLPEIVEDPAIAPDRCEIRNLDGDSGTRAGSAVQRNRTRLDGLAGGAAAGELDDQSFALPLLCAS